MSDLLNELRRKGGKYITIQDGVERGIRYRNGRFEILCPTCPFERWVPVADEYAERYAKSLLKK